MVCFSEIQQFPYFVEISVPFVSVVKFLEFLVEWKAPSFTGLGYLRFHILHSVRIRDEKVMFVINQFPRPKLAEEEVGDWCLLPLTQIWLKIQTKLNCSVIIVNDINFVTLSLKVLIKTA